MKIFLGVFRGRIIGIFVVVIVENRDVDFLYYEEIRNMLRLGYVDYLVGIKYFGYNDYRGGGYFLGRLMVGVVIVGYFVKKFLEREGIKVRVYFKWIGCVEVYVFFEELLSFENFYCFDEGVFEVMVEEMERVRKVGDSVGGIVEVVVFNVFLGLGGFWEEDIEVDIVLVFFRILVVKGVEFGLGFGLVEFRGS